MSNNNTLSELQIAIGDGAKNNGDGSMATANANGVGDMAVNALRLLIESGKVSIDDANAAFKSVQNTKDAATVKEPAPSNKTESGESKNNSKTKKKNKPKKQEQYRTRHVALQFSYDGTDFSGFAENLGKKCDYSVEKALFAALNKTRILVSPEQNGMLVSNNEDQKAVEAEQTDKINGKSAGGSLKEDILESISSRAACKYSRCGRTDKGVHANGQVVALYLRSAFPLSAQEVTGSKVLEEESLPKNSLDGLECLVPPKNSKGKDGSFEPKTITEFNYPRILNNVLPPSIRILGWCPVSSEFSARFSCGRRTYRYFFPRRNLDLSAMAQGLQYMMGRHDFRNFCKMNIEQVYNFERVIMSGKVVSPQKVHVTSMEAKEVSVEEVLDAPVIHFSPTDMCHVEIVGQAFLWHQIRCIMSILFNIGRQVESPELVQELFDVETNPAKPSYELASETGLVLQDCKFGHLNLGRTVPTLWGVTKTLEQRWETHAVSAERAKDALVSLKKETEVRWTDVTEFVQQIARDRMKKEQKRNNGVLKDDGEIGRALEERAPMTAMISWESAIHIVQDVLGVCPHRPNGTSHSKKGCTESSLHVPLMERAKGTTYEEKVKSILRDGVGDSKSYYSASKRKARYEDNIIKKRKTSEEDKAFYAHMLQQGGSSV